MIKHVSFDVWNTLVEPNPEFATHRTACLARALELDANFVRRTYTQVKAIVDDAATRDGTAFSTPGVYDLLFASCGLSVSPPRAREIRLAVDDVFRQHPPILVPSVIELVRWLRARGITTSIGSNSNFIAGDVMHPFLETAIDHEFRVGIYSDQIQCGKPSPAFFARIFDRLRDMNPTIRRHDILHVGDHPQCDLGGARAAGMQGLLIASPDSLCEQVKHHMNVEA